MDSVLVIGNFDGVHRGHAVVIAAARKAAPQARLVAVTFWPHPMSVIRPGHAPLLLADLDQRRRLLLAAGCDQVEVVQFTQAVAQWSPAEFVDNVLLPLHPATIVVGKNFRFGHQAAGDVRTLTQLGRGRYVVEALDLAALRGGAVSSSRVRVCLAEGDVVGAGELLGRPFRFTGMVCRGDQRGREMGFPTANVPVPVGFAVPVDGVYAGWTTLLDHDGAPAHERWPAAISVGTNPTFDGVERRVEAHVLDRDDLELYDRKISVDFVQRLRGQVKYTGMGALIEQMHRDVDQVRRLLS